MLDPLPIQPFAQPVRGSVRLPGSKSITNRALLLAALSDGPVSLTGALFSEDTELMAAALRKLGFQIDEKVTAGTISVIGLAGRIPVAEAELFVGLAGTAARFLTALCAAAPSGIYRLDGVPQMRKRPMKGLIDALRALGADIRCPGAEGFFPLEIHARGLVGGQVEIDASESSQLLSALLMVAPLAKTDVEVTLRGSVRWSYVEMTGTTMESFGQPKLNRKGGSTFVIEAGNPYRFDGAYAIEPDASAASYFLALPLVTGGELTLLGAQDSGQGLQGDTAFADIVRAVGGTVSKEVHGLRSAYSSTNPRVGLERNFKAISDTFLTLAAIAPLLKGPTRITGIAHSRKQETDRVSGMANELKKLGQEVIEEEDSLEIHPRPLKTNQVIETYGDHRFAMSFGILGCHDLKFDGSPWLSIKNPGCCAKTFPQFFEVLEALRKASS